MPYVSASQINAFRRCQSFWWNGWVKKIKEPPSPAMLLGQEHSTHLEEYLKGERKFEDMMELARIGGPFLPDPQSEVPALKVEHKILFPSSVPGVDYIGYIDLGEIWPDRVRIRDHKTRARKKWALSPEQLREDVQVNLYGHWVYYHSGWDHHDGTIDLEHINYYKDRLVSDLTSTEWSKEVSDGIFAKCERDVIVMQQLRQETDRAHVPGDRTSCFDFNRRCPHADYCPHFESKPPMSVFGNNDKSGGANPLERLGLVAGKTTAPEAPVPEAMAPKSPELPGAASALDRLKSVETTETPGTGVLAKLRSQRALEEGLVGALPSKETDSLDDEFEAGFDFEGLLPPDAPPNVDPPPAPEPEPGEEYPEALPKKALEHFGEHGITPRELLDLTRDQWLEVPGVGPKRLEKILSALHPDGIESEGTEPAEPTEGGEDAPADKHPAPGGAPEPPAGDSFDLYIKCVPLGEAHTLVEKFLDEVIEETISVLGGDYRLADFGRGYEQLQVFVERDVEMFHGNVVVMDPYSGICKAILPVLRKHARRVVAGM